MTRTSAAALVLCLAVTACGGGDAPNPAAPTATATTGAGSDPRSVGGPGAAGTVAAISGATLQVRSEQTGQVSVTYTDATTFSEQVAASAADLEVGDCVMVSSDVSTDASEPPGSGDPVQAATVRITEPQGGECTGGQGGPGGGRPTNATPPSGAPGAAPSGAPAPGGRFGGAFGEVTGVTAAGFTVDATNAETTRPTETAVSVSSSTTWTRAATTTSKVLEVGQCVAVTGDADDTGAVTARTISIEPAVNGECAVGFGRRPDRIGQESS